MLTTKQKSARSKQENPVTANRVSDSGITCMLAKGTTIEGNFSSAESVRMDGIFIGNINCDKRLVIGSNAHIKGNLRAEEVVINGLVEGDIVANQLVYLDVNAKVIGDIQAADLLVLEGATFDGTCSIGSKTKS